MAVIGVEDSKYNDRPLIPFNNLHLFFKIIKRLFFVLENH